MENHVAWREQEATAGRACSLNAENLNLQISSLVGAITQLTVRIEHLVGLHERMVKWLLIVVCAIALGKGVIDMAEGFIK